MPETRTSPVGEAKRTAQDAVDAWLPDLIRLSHDIHAHPELSYEEVRSSALAAEALAQGGVRLTTGAADLPTAFTAEGGSGPLVIAICAEYDALPDIGHACGHNIIAASAVGAGLALASVAGDLGLTVRVLGTPAEEGGGGKVLMLERGAFDGVHAAMMVHPWPTERLTPICLAVAHFDVRYARRAPPAAPR